MCVWETERERQRALAVAKCQQDKSNLYKSPLIQANLRPRINHQKHLITAEIITSAGLSHNLPPWDLKKKIYMDTDFVIFS